MIFVLAPIIPLVLLGLTIVVIVFGAKAAVSGDGKAEDVASHDGVEIAKSAGIHVGLFLAMIAGAVGIIDLLQSIVEDQRIAGANPDVARGLALLIVGGPVFVLLLRLVSKRYADRSTTGDTKAHLGWSIYLVAALSVTLIAWLVGTAKVADKLTSSTSDFRPEELMQLIGWLGVWLVHWFVLRPQFGVRSVYHLAVGSIIGLGWLVVGVGAVGNRILVDAYQSALSEPLTRSYGVTYWVVIALAGAVVWGWHWHAHLNTVSGVEGDARRSSPWFFVVVVAGVLPGLISMVVAATTIVISLLIWVVGTTEEKAVDFFIPSVALISVFLVGLVSWAYHRWELQRGGLVERNESLRFHDYVVLAVAWSVLWERWP